MTQQPPILLLEHATFLPSAPCGAGIEDTNLIQLSRLFGLPRRPNGSLAQAPQHVLLKAACIRAFLGRPILLLLERPTDRAHAEIVPGLMQLIGLARHRGAAVLWLTAETEVWKDPEIRPDRRLRVSGTRLLTDQR